MKKPKDTTLAISADYRQFVEKLLLNQIKAGAYERAITEKKTHNFDLVLPEHFTWHSHLPFPPADTRLRLPDLSGQEGTGP